MPRRAVWAVLCILGLIVGALLPSVRAQQLLLEITSPGVGERVRGRVPIIGSAQVPDFQFYKVEFGIGPNPSQWAVIGTLHEQPVINGQLEVWDTTVLPDDVYTLRLTGVKKDGNWEEFYVRNVIVANKEPTPTPTPEVSPTPMVTLLPTLPGGTPPSGVATPATVPTPEPTSALRIIQPTAALVPATPTPRVAEAVGERFPIDVASLRSSFCFGGLATAAIFVLVGIVLGIRRLL